MEHIYSLLCEAYQKMKKASYQAHDSHWDREGTGGLNCPECLRARSLRKEAEKIYTRAIVLKNKIENMS